MTKAMGSIWRAGLGILFGGMAAVTLHGQTHQGVELVKARLIADSETVAPGRPVTLGLHLKMAPNWHTYWDYSGDAGLPTSLDLELPEGFRATPIQWPVPKRFEEPGGLEVYGYKDEVLLMVRVFPPARIEGSEIEISGSASWLVCEAICLPGREEFSLTLAAGDDLEPANAELFERFQAELPQPLRGRDDEPVSVAWERQRREFRLAVEGPAEWSFDFFPQPPEGVVLGHPETSRPAGAERAIIRIPVTTAPADLARLPGVLVATAENGERRSWQVPNR